MIYIAIILTILCIFSIANLTLTIIAFLANRNTSKAPATPPHTSSSLSEEEIRELAEKRKAEDEAFQELMGYNAAVAYGIAKKGLDE